MLTARPPVEVTSDSDSDLGPRPSLNVQSETDSSDQHLSPRPPLDYHSEAESSLESFQRLELGLTPRPDMVSEETNSESDCSKSLSTVCGNRLVVGDLPNPDSKATSNQSNFFLENHITMENEPHNGSPALDICQTANDDYQPSAGIESYLTSHPSLWSSAIAEIPTIAPGSWLGGYVVEVYCLALFLRSQTRKVQYIPLAFSQKTQIPDEAEVQAFTNAVDKHSDPDTPMAFVRHERDHYYVIVFDYANQRCVTFGQFISADTAGIGVGNWDSWSGSRTWDVIAAFNGWRNMPKPRAQESVNWEQNGTDCGADASSVIQYLLEQGLPSCSHLVIPDRCCPHLRRQYMLNAVCRHTYHAYRWFQLQHGVPSQLLEEHQQALESGWDHWPPMQEVGGKLTRSHQRCVHCRQAAQVSAPRPTTPPANSASSDSDSLSPGSDLGPLEGIVTPHPKEAQASRPRKAHHPAHYTIPLKVNAYRELITSFRVGATSFDDYTGGPVLEDNLSIPINILNFPDNPYAQRIHSSVWTMFRDYGYRIEPSFYQLFNREPPQELLQHVLPIPPPSPEVPVRPDALSLRQLLQMAADKTKDIDYLLCGRLPHNHKHLICIDPRLDACQGVNTSISVDIDSVIWVAHRLKFKLGAKLRMGSTYNREAPIARNNHVYVTLLHPRSEADREENGGHRQEWFKTRHGLHSLPHMHFVQCGEGSGSFNAYIFFPRMKHKSEFGRRSISIIPIPVQDLFYAQVLLPALKAVYRASGKSYLVETIGQLKYMIGERGRPINFPLDPDQMIALQHSMQDRINQDSDLTMFGSFFFVVDARGIKLWTVDGAQVAPDPFTALQVQSPNLDWDFMMDRTHGELLLDLGVSFHPVSRASSSSPANTNHSLSCSPMLEGRTPSGSSLQGLEKDGIVGLWDLDFLRRSYIKAGFQAPNVHRSCTLANVGNLQAEMTSTRRRGTHIAFRQSYNLAFEVIRRPGSQFQICSDAVAYRGNRGFKDAVDAVVSQIRDSAGKSYGVREEMRIGGGALKTILESVTTKAQAYLAANPILWVPSSTWFHFLERRILAIKEAQVQISRMSAPNQGITTSIMMYIMRSTLVNPQRIPSFLHYNLRCLRFEETITDWGAFFMHSLHVEAGYVSDIEEDDTAEVHHHMGVTVTKGSRKRQVFKPSYPFVENVESPDFPLGAQPSWETVQEFLGSRPHLFLKPWTFPTHLTIEAQASHLFIEFTAQAWFLLND